jgi:cytidylate kinase
MKKVLIISGSAGSGKSTICGMLKERNFQAYDSGQLLRWIDYKYEKPEKYHHDCLQEALRKNDPFFILCTCMNPLEFKKFENDFENLDIHFIALYASSVEINRRLKARPASRGFTNLEAINHQLNYNEWYLGHQDLFELFIDTTIIDESVSLGRIMDFINNVCIPEQRLSSSN